MAVNVDGDKGAMNCMRRKIAMHDTSKVMLDCSRRILDGDDFMPQRTPEKDPR